MKKHKNLVIISAILVIITLFLSGCGKDEYNTYPGVEIVHSSWSYKTRIDVGGGVVFNRFERFDDENEAKLILYFDKKVGESEK